ncbi:hypothetical protein FRUB_03044 [Fimbriiglobus ruber]|uniref:Uncharacterized protein n=1 Tax=Fimbriiglobus ruber TaxID=1908690 RepID=A0A225E434_9BACT|nr:hypothetical protein FRUB_03044 [Fimbriiglobus ruber]
MYGVSLRSKGRIDPQVRIASADHVPSQEGEERSRTHSGKDSPSSGV